MKEAHHCSSFSTPVERKIGHIYLQHISCLIIGILRAARKLGVENEVISLPDILKLDDTCSEIISCTVEHSTKGLLFVENAGAEDLSRFDVLAAPVLEIDFRFLAIIDCLNLV